MTATIDPGTKRGKAARARAELHQPKKKKKGGAGAGVGARALLVELPTRRGTPLVTAHLGPTNSGKTHAALEALLAAGHGAYASPLRMLAQEVHAKLATLQGAQAAGLITGEERINEHARLVACTVELAPLRTDVLVVDEVHWAADPERGQAWTRLLLAAECRELHLVGSPDVLPLLRAAFPGLTVKTYDRFGPLTFTGKTALAKVREQTVVVAFSRKAVLALARELTHAKPGRKVGALYGAMPLAERRRQIEAFTSGRTDVLVATDVLGHGVNLPCHTVLFAEDSKYDGSQRRQLVPWEVAQIAGRAGRFGHHDAGEVGTLAGLRWLSVDPEVIESGLAPGVDLGEGLRGFRRLRKASLGPRLEDLAGVPVRSWPLALEIWATRAIEQARATGWLKVADVQPVVGRLRALGQKLLDHLPPQDAWAFALAPVDAARHGAFLAQLAQGVAFDIDLSPLVSLKSLTHASLEEAESAASLATLLRWFTRRFPGKGKISQNDADVLEIAAGELVGKLIGPRLVNNKHGRCESCGKPTAPWFYKCDACFTSGWSYNDY